MAQFRIGAAAYVIAGVLVVAASGIAWTRSRVVQVEAAAIAAVAETTASSVAPSVGGTTHAESYFAVDSTIFIRDCRSCHGAGEARGRRIPALRGLTVQLFTADGGRDYLIDFMFDGRVRIVEKGSVTFAKTHPEYVHLTNAEVAGVLNYMLTAWGNDALLPKGTRLYTAAEVARRRPKG